MILSIASGKGGTGKTTVAVNMALSLKDVQLLDCDVEEPNVHLLLPHETNEEKPVYVSTPQVNEELCDHCGKCSEFCEFNALFVTPEKVLFFPELCHSCGGCLLVCPKNAITEKNVQIGVVKKGAAEGMELVYGELNVGEPMSIPVIREVKKQIRSNKTVIIDSPPGASCPVIESVHGSDYCLLVSEPTPFGLHDLRIMVKILEALGIPFGVVINRAGIGDRKIYDFCEEKGVPILFEIPFQREIAELYSRGIPFVVDMPEWKRTFQLLMDDIKGCMES
ncbi:MAG: ATP-binding protein [Candidatus Bathyarchaeota archaeon]|nr:ATP-binding protein [Candidatus Bathyarchaeota archaeon]MDH5732168.1 ATP-binding protein [Candidatus Bathyarchaeota archaeon]